MSKVSTKDFEEDLVIVIAPISLLSLVWGEDDILAF